jgi:hypothetical protein
VGKPEEKEPKRKPTHRCVVNVNICLSYELGKDWIDLALHKDQRKAVVNMVISILFVSF